MSKRVVIAVLISLVVIAAAFTSVQALGVLRNAGSDNVASMSVDNRALGKANMHGLDSYFFDDGTDSGHECGKDPTVDY
ncbi:MAG: hypothetical protein HZB18_13020 [Chloroflexi bacterium]|nr:hypothetical protein [Chloroflexota bacterium]